jgi:hypothetical protein
MGDYFNLVFVPHRAWHGGDEQQPNHWSIN